MSIDEAISSLKNFNTREEHIRCAALALRSEILQTKTSKMPAETSIQSLRESSPAIPPLTKLFFNTLLGGLNPNRGDEVRRRTLSMASDAVFATSRGTVRPWKNTLLGLSFASMFGSHTAITILNRLGHSVSYDVCKQLETEIAYTCSSRELETPSGLLLQGDLATGKIRFQND